MNAGGKKTHTKQNKTKKKKRKRPINNFSGNRKDTAPSTSSLKIIASPGFSVVNYIFTQNHRLCKNKTSFR
jgi:hypothetical protein